MKTKTTKVIIAAVNVYCPECEEIISEKSGSYVFGPGEYESGKIILCDTCGSAVRLPKINFQQPVQK